MSIEVEKLLLTIEKKKEYKRAIKAGDGAYLLEEKKTDLFEIQVGNIPPNTRVSIWISYISELQFENSNITFFLPYYISPVNKSSQLAWLNSWATFAKKLSILSSKNQKKGKILENSKPLAFSLVIEISNSPNVASISSPTHQMEISKENSSITATYSQEDALDKGF